MEAKPINIQNSRRVFILITLGLANFLPSTFVQNGFAQDAESVDIMGTWAFETAPYRQGKCAISGLAHITPGTDERTLACQLTVVEQCEADARTVALQSCFIRQIGRILVVRSQIIETFEEGDTDVMYFPDNFQLEIVSDKELSGELKSASNAPVTFKRTAGGIS